MTLHMLPPVKRSIFVLVAISTFCLPAAAFAMTSGGSQLLQTSQIVDTSLPFLHDASSGFNVTEVTGGIAKTQDSTAIAGGLTSQANHCNFQDISGRSSEKAIKFLYDQNIAGGRRPCYFDPDLLATRAEVAAMATRAVQASTPSEVAEKPFPDVSTVAWHARYIKSAKTRGVVSGYPDALFRPDRPVDKVETLKILTRTYASDFSKVNLSNLRTYPDLQANQWYAPYVSSALEQGIVGQDNAALYIAPGVFKPAQYLTREQVANLLYALMLQRFNQSK